MTEKWCWIEYFDLRERQSQDGENDRVKSLIICAFTKYNY